MNTIHLKLLILIGLIAITNAFVIENHQQSSQDTASQPPLCTSDIYCSGDVLHTIQMAKLFNDSKTFVDMKLKRPPNETVKLFREFMNEHDQHPSKEDIIQFVSQNFDKRGTEFTEWMPTDWTESPKYLSRVKDTNFRWFGGELNKLWKILGRKMKNEVAENPDLYSIIYVKNGVIVPGGRFLEFYYWDSYWIILGLLHSEMQNTAKGMLLNFFSVIDRYGFIPNGGRIYYLTRSHPPMLSSMVKAYIDHTGDDGFISEAIHRLDAEFEFFENNRMHEVNGHRLAAYGSDELYGPRPESYREDYLVAHKHFGTETERQQFYTEMIAGAESGWDFSSRWFIKNGTNDGQLFNTHAKSIISVELNAMLYFNAKTIAEFHTKLGNTNIAAKYEIRARQIFEAVQAVLWNDEHGAWFDYDLMNKKSRPYFAPTNLSPLFFGCYDKANKAEIARKVLAYLDSTGIDRFPGGLPSTVEETGEQWDYPNAWAPLQHWMAEGLRTLDDENATKLANKWTRRWTLSNFIAYNETKYMFEKYSAEKLGGHGSGGEYVVQIGFGWSNGVIIDYLAKYGDILKSFD